MISAQLKAWVDLQVTLEHSKWGSIASLTVSGKHIWHSVCLVPSLCPQSCCFCAKHSVLRLMSLVKVDSFPFRAIIRPSAISLRILYATAGSPSDLELMIFIVILYDAMSAIAYALSDIGWRGCSYQMPIIARVGTANARNHCLNAISNHSSANSKWGSEIIGIGQ